MEIEKRFKEYYDKIKRNGKEKVLEYLKRSDYFKAPASTIYHSSIEGGLVYHSIKVVEYLEKLVKNNNLVFEKEDSIYVIGLLHDICKTYYYDVEYRNTKNEQGEWIKKPYYKVKDLMPVGVHGDKSVMLLLKLGLELTTEEIYCIRYHIGAYESKEVLSSLGEAKHRCNNILWVQLADELATLEEDKGQKDLKK